MTSMIHLPQFFEQKNSQAHNLYRLFMLRNLLIVLAILFIIYFESISFAIPVISTILFFAILFFINLVTGCWLYYKKPVTDNTIMWQLIIDVAALTGGLYITGGASNPIDWFYLVPIFIAATLLPGRAIWLISSLSMIGYTTLFFIYEPVMHDAPPHLIHSSGFQKHIIGMWLGYIITAFLVSYVVTNMANSLRERDQDLALARENALRDERLVALGTLAAGTAHELGTPLSTIAIVVNEMQNNCEPCEISDDLSIIRDQVERCKLALSTLSHSAGEKLMTKGQMLPVKQYISNIITQWQQQRPSTTLELDTDLNQLDAHILAEQTISQALINILNNAADASPEKITLNIEQTEQHITLSIKDNGDGLDSMIQQHAGKHAYSSKKQGLGLGLFLAYASIERLGGKIFLANQEQGGAVVKIILPLTESNLKKKNNDA